MLSDITFRPMDISNVWQSKSKDFDFGEALIWGSNDLKKSDRTRAILQKAGCDLLHENSLSSLTVAMVCKETGVAHGTFYIYFKDLHDFIGQILRQFVSFTQLAMLAATKSKEVDSVRVSTLVYYRLFCANPGLMKCLLNHSEDFYEAKLALQKLNLEWATTIVNSMIQKGCEQDKYEELMRRAYALGGMVDQYLNSLLLNKDPTVRVLSKDEDLMIDSLTAIWKQGLIL